MRRTTRHCTSLGTMVMAVLVASLAGSSRAAADDDPWRLKLGAVATESLNGGVDGPSYGAGAGLEYRFSPRVGLELAAITAEDEDEIGFSFFDELSLGIESRVRMTPVMAKLDLHLTPDSRVDFYLAPVAAYVKMSDLRLTFRAEAGDDRVTEVEHIDLEDKFAWGLSLGMDVPIGRGGSFFNLGATYLRLPLSVRDGEDFSTAGDIDPIFVQVGYGLRF
jgi:outer membrane protein W